MTTAIERLEEMLDAKDAELSCLQRKLDEAERQIEYDAGWCRHVECAAGSEPNPELPIPRLEIRWSDIEGETIAVYSLVYRHTCDQIVFAPLGRTKTSGALNHLIRKDGVIHTPFRDGVHFVNEMRQLKLRGFVICGDHTYEAKLCYMCERLVEVHSQYGGGFNESCTMPRGES